MIAQRVIQKSLCSIDCFIDSGFKNLPHDIIKLICSYLPVTLYGGTLYGFQRYVSKPRNWYAASSAKLLELDWNTKTIKYFERAYENMSPLAVTTYEGNYSPTPDGQFIFNFGDKLKKATLRNDEDNGGLQIEMEGQILYELNEKEVSLLKKDHQVTICFKQ